MKCLVNRIGIAGDDGQPAARLQARHEHLRHGDRVREVLVDVGEKNRVKISGGAVVQFLLGDDPHAALAGDGGSVFIRLDADTIEAAGLPFQDASGAAAKIEHAAPLRQTREGVAQELVGRKIGVDLERRVLQPGIVGAELLRRQRV